MAKVELTKHLFQSFPHLEGKELVVEKVTFLVDKLNGGWTPRLSGHEGASAKLERFTEIES